MIKSSIIIPTAGRPFSLKNAVNSILKVNPHEYSTEIIVVDNNATEVMSDEIKYCKSLGNMIRYIREESPGLSAARHRGAFEAKGEILTFIDDDVEVTSSWLPTIQTAFSNPDIAMVGGPSIPNFTGSIPSWFWDFIRPTIYGGWMCPWLSLLDIGHDVIDIDPNYIWGLNFSIRKSILYKCGGFNPDAMPIEFQRWQGDGETGLTMKVKAAGYRAAYCQSALLFHHCGTDRLTLDYFKKRAYYTGICQSFSEIRKLNLPTIYSSLNNDSILYMHLRRYIGIAVRSIIRKKSLSAIWSSEESKVKSETYQSSREGWLFHQKEVNSDPELLAWVNRENYYDTDLRNFKIK